MSSPRSTRIHARFVTACQQLLVLGVICAVLTPAAGIVSIELGPAPGGQGSGTALGAPAPAVSLQFAAYAKAQTKPALVPTAVVDPTVREVKLTAPEGARVAPGMLANARTKAAPGGGARLVSSPQQVTGYGAIGVTWQHGELVPDDAITIKARTKDADGWSGWIALDYHDDHGPDPDSEEGRRARPGTDELLVGDVDSVQVKVLTTSATPSDLSLAVIDPGVATTSERELPAIDTGAGDGDVEPAVAPTLPTSDGDAQLAAASFTPKPQIYSRAQWGADESMRDPGSLHYYEVHAGFVHHTVNANDYKAKDVPAILRGIYAYHTQSRGWSDVGYNYLVDRFGRIWEGRYGGVDRPVVGAHTLGYNDDAFAASAIGNFEEVQPSRAMIQAYGALFGWKLSLHGVDPASTKQYVTSRYFQAINGHRDAASTACPGKYLYAKIPEIRRLAAQAQVGFEGRQLESDIASSDLPDLVVRSKTDGMGYTIPLRTTKTGYATSKPIAMAVDLSKSNRLMSAGDWDRDGFGDIITRRASDGSLWLRRGLGNGKFAAVQRLAPATAGFADVKLLAAVGDMTGDGWPDLMGQPAGGAMRIYPGLGLKGVGASYVAYSNVTGNRQIPVGLWDADGAPDSLFRNGGSLVLYPGNGPGGLTGGKTLSLDVRGYDWITGISDVDLVGHPDLVARRKATGELLLIPGTTTGFGTPVVLGTGFESYDLFG